MARSITSPVRPRAQTVEQWLLVTLRAVSPELNGLITQAMTEEAERRLLAYYRALSDRARRLIRCICADFARLAR